MEEITNSWVASVIGSVPILGQIYRLISKSINWAIKKCIKQEEVRTRHLSRIKEGILNPFLQKLRSEEKTHKGYFPSLLPQDFKAENEFELINIELFKDALENHFSEIKNHQKELEEKKRLFDEKIKKITKRLEKKFNKHFYEKSIKGFFIFGQDKNLKLGISYDRLMYNSSVICDSNEEDSKKIKESLEKIYKNKTGKEIRNRYTDLSKIRQKLIRSIERALVSEFLEGNCNFINCPNLSQLLKRVLWGVIR